MEKKSGARLDADSCRTKAEECRRLAKTNQNAAHRVMLLHMAETWERIADTYGGEPDL
jgi:hypothetical protein